MVDLMVTSCRWFSGPIIKSGAVKIALHSSAKSVTFHSGMLYLQLVPFPTNPSLQEQLNDPSMFLQVAWELGKFDIQSNWFLRLTVTIRYCYPRQYSID